MGCVAASPSLDLPTAASTDGEPVNVDDDCRRAQDVMRQVVIGSKTRVLRGAAIRDGASQIKFMDAHRRAMGVPLCFENACLQWNKRNI
jgi:hypothetical protein